MSRKMLFLYMFLGLTAFIAALAIVAPPLAVVPFGFSVIFLPFLFVSLFIEWAIPKASSFTQWLSVLALIALFMVMGSILAAGTAGLLTTVVYLFKKRPVSPKPEPAKTLDNAQYEFQGTGYRVSYSPVEQGARYTP